jgi:hypothetical protein
MSVLKMVRPRAGFKIAFLCKEVKRGGKNPRVESTKSKIALLSGCVLLGLMTTPCPDRPKAKEKEKTKQQILFNIFKSLVSDKPFLKAGFPAKDSPL